MARRVEVIRDTGADEIEVAGEVVILKMDAGDGGGVALGCANLGGEKRELVLQAREILALAVGVGSHRPGGRGNKGGDGEAERQ